MRYESESIVFGMKRPMQFLTKMHQPFVSARLLILKHVFFCIDAFSPWEAVKRTQGTLLATSANG